MLLVAFASGASPAANTETDAGAGATNQKLNEIVIRGSRARLADIRERMVNVEDRFYARYNALNADDRFDIHCEDSARTGTALRRRTCRAVFESRAHLNEGRQHLLALQHHSEVTSGGNIQPMEWIPPAPAIVAIEPLKKPFRQTMLQVARDNPELVDLLRERAELAREYEALHSEIFRRGDGEDR